MHTAIVSDTSCLILFSKIGELDLLRKLYGKIYITKIVCSEFGEDIPDWIEVSTVASGIYEHLSGYLDEGEASSIALALEFESPLLIMDEIKGRRAARDMGLPVTGSLGLLIAAKEKGHIKQLKPVIEKIQKTNFRISKILIDHALKRVKEL